MQKKQIKMNKIFPVIISVFISAVLLVSCDDRTTYAEDLKAERLLIADYIKRNNIQVVSEFPAGNDAWPENLFVKTTSGLYFHLAHPGDTTSTDTLETYDLVSVRYLQYTLTQNPDTIFSWNTIDSPYATTFNYQDLNGLNNKAWHEALSYMKRNESQAKIIVTSKLGLESNMQSVTPYGYDLKLQFRK